MKKEMELPETVKAFNAELAEMLTMKPPVSSSKMKDITKAGMRAQKYYKHVVLSVEKLIQKSKPDYKLSGVYVIDAIVRQSRHQNTPEMDNYGPRFQNNLTTTVTNLFKCSRSDQVKISRTLKLWEMNGVFSLDVVTKCLSLTDISIKNEGIKLAEAVKVTKPNVAKTELLKQKQELEEQQRQIMDQQKQLAKQQEALLKQSSSFTLSTIPPILGNLLQFGAKAKGTDIPGFGTDKETVNKVKQLLDDFDYGEDDEIKVPQKEVKKNGSATPPVKHSELLELNTPSPIAPLQNDSLYDPTTPDKKVDDDKYRSSKVDRSIHRSSSKRRHRSRSREADRIKDRCKDRSKERSKDRKEKKVEEKKHKSRTRGKRSRSASPSHIKEKKVKDDRFHKNQCVTILSTTLWIGNLRKTVTKEDISTLMKKYGKTDSIDMVPPRGCVYVCVKDRDTAKEALKDWKGLKLHGAACKIAWAPGKGCKDYKHYWDVDSGVTYIPHKEFEKLKFSSLEEGGVIDADSLPVGYVRREEAAVVEDEGPGSILEKLLVSMRGKKDPEETPFSQFLSNDKTNIAQQEQEVSAKLDQLDQLTIPSKNTNIVLEDDSIVHLLNSKDYTLTDAMSTHSPEETCMSPPECLLPEGVIIAKSPVRSCDIIIPPDDPLVSPTPIETSEIKAPEDVSVSIEKSPEENKTPIIGIDLTPIKTPSHDTGNNTSTTEEVKVEDSFKEKKTINLQTYLKRKRDDENEEEIKETPEGDGRAETPPPVNINNHSANVSNHNDDLLEWVTNQEEEEEEEEKKNNLIEEKEKSVEKEDQQRIKSSKDIAREHLMKNLPVNSERSKELSDHSQQEDKEKDLDEKEEIIDDEIRSPQSSPVDSLLEEKLASPSILKEDTPPLCKSSPSRSSQSKLSPSKSNPSDQSPFKASPSQPSISKLLNTSKITPSKPLDSSLDQLKMDYDASDMDSDMINEKREMILKSSVTTKLHKKDKKHKSKKKKKKSSSRHMEEELEEDIRRLEFLKAELEREERKERREEKRKEREKRQRNISTSRSPSRHSKEKRRKDKRTRR